MLKTEDVLLMGNSRYEKYPDFLISSLLSGLRVRAVPTFDGNPNEMFSMMCDKNQKIERNVQAKLSLAFTDVLSDYLIECCNLPFEQVKDPQNFLKYSIFDLESAFPNENVPKIPALDWIKIINYAEICKIEKFPQNLQSLKPWCEMQPLKANDYSIILNQVPKQNYDVYIVAAILSAYSIYAKDAGKDNNGKSVMNIFGANNQLAQKIAFFSTIDVIKQDLKHYLSSIGFSSGEADHMVTNCGLDVSSYLSPKFPQIKDPVPLDWLRIATYSKDIIEKEQNENEKDYEI